MSGRNFLSLVLMIGATFLLGLTGCSKGESDERGCLTLGCPGFGDDANINEGGTLTLSGTVTNSFSCSIVSDYTVIQSQEQFGVSITAQGTFTPPLEITKGLTSPVENFWQSIKIFGSITHTGSSVLNRVGGVTLKDANGRTAACTYSVVVYPQNTSSGLGCDITPSNNVPMPGEQVSFKFTGRGGNGTYVFSDFRPFAERLIDNSYITKVSNTESKASFSYTTAVTRFASVLVKSGNDASACRVPIYVGGSYPAGYTPGWDWGTLPPWFIGGGFYPYPVTPVQPSTNTCDIVMSPSPGIAGTLTNLKVVVPSYVSGGPFEIAGLAESLPGIQSSSLIDDLPAIARPSTLERKVRFRNPGLHTVTVNYRNAAGTVRGSCVARHQANPAGQFAVSPDQSSVLSINTYTGAAPLYGASASVPDTSHMGARVARADVNGDGIADLIVGSGKDLVNASNPIYRVVVRDGRNLSTVLYDFNPLPSHPDGNGGVFVAGGDVNGDGKAEIIVGQDAQYAAGKSGSWIKVYNISTGTPVLQNAVQPFGATGNYGVRVASGDVNGDGLADILAIPGAEGGAVVKVYSGAALPTFTTLHSFSALLEAGDAPLKSGAFIAAGDVDLDGKADILTSLDTKSPSDGANYKRSIYIYSGATGAVQAYKPAPYGFAYDGGIRVAAGDIDGDGRSDIFVVPGTAMPNDGYGSYLRVGDFFTHSQKLNLVPYTYTHSLGMFVGAGAGGL